MMTKSRPVKVIACGSDVEFSMCCVGPSKGQDQWIHSVISQALDQGLGRVAPIDGEIHREALYGNTSNQSQG